MKNGSSPVAGPVPDSQIGADAFKSVVQGGQTASELPIKAVGPVRTPPGDDTVFAENDSPESKPPGRENKVSGNPIASPPRQTHSVGTGVHKNVPLPGFSGRK
jgi:hypothetical protein